MAFTVTFLLVTFLAGVQAHMQLYYSAPFNASNNPQWVSILLMRFEESMSHTETALPVLLTRTSSSLTTAAMVKLRPIHAAVTAIYSALLREHQ
jgi:hypothetical protein